MLDRRSSEPGHAAARLFQSFDAGQDVDNDVVVRYIVMQVGDCCS
jgi:hypothetical protein